MEFHRSAFKYGHDESAILHAITVIDLDPDADPAKVLAIGPDSAGNFMEVIWPELDNTVELVIHAMAFDPCTTTCSQERRTTHDIHSRNQNRPHPH